MYVYDDDFLPFGGIPPEAVLQHAHGFFTCFEEIFQRMKPERGIKAEADLQTLTTRVTALRGAKNTQSRHPAYPTSLDAAADDGEGKGRVRAARQPKYGCWPWPSAVRYVLTHVLTQTRLVEWCETEDQQSSCVGYTDICFAYDRPDSEDPWPSPSCPLSPPLLHCRNHGALNLIGLRLLDFS